LIFSILSYSINDRILMIYNFRTSAGVNGCVKLPNYGGIS